MKRTIILLAFIISTSLLTTTAFTYSGNQTFDFTLSGENDRVFVLLGGETSIKLMINLTSGEAKNVSLHGEWIGGIAPGDCSIEPSYGYPPFETNLTFKAFSKGGYYTYVVEATGGNVTRYYEIEVVVTDVEIEIYTDKESYRKGEEIHIFGNITSIEDSSVSSANLTISCEEWERYVSLDIVDGHFNYTYNISFGDPEGRWVLKIDVIDSNGNRVFYEKKINVTLPQDVVRYKVTFLSPPEGAVYVRGTSFNVSVFVSSGDSGVSGLLTTCIFPSMDKINLTEIGGGYYRGEYTIPWDGVEGKWFLSVDSRDEESGFAGGSSSYIVVEPAPIKIDVIKPSSDKIEYGKEVKIEVKLTYPDGQPVNDAIVTASTPHGNISFSFVGNGTYASTYTPSGNTKYWLFSLNATDRYNNTGSIQHTFYIVYRQTFSIGLSSILGILTVLGTSGAIFYYTRKSVFTRRLEDVKRELDEIRRLQKDTVIRYYKEGTISRKTYDLLMQEYAKAYGRLMDEYGELLTKMQSRKFKWKGLKDRFRTPS